MRTLIRIIIALGLLPLAGVSAAQNTAAYLTAQERLQRGAFYYHYYNSEYQDALNALAALNDINPDAGKDKELQLMHAAILLSLGLSHDAEQVFSRSESTDATANAWFFLARAWWQSGDWQACETSSRKALSVKRRLGTARDSIMGLKSDYVAEANFMLSASLAAQDKVQEAEDVLNAIPQTSIWAGYARYNLIIAHIRLFTPGHKIQALVDEAAYYLPDTYEGNSLKDRVFLVAGINALNAGKKKQAADYLKKISLDSAFTAPGLLQYGWALTEQWNYQQAMQPWRVLQEKYQPFHPAVMESVLAVPHALELLNANTQALKTYEMVEQKLQTMLSRVQEQHRKENIQQWLTTWLAQQDAQWGWQRTAITDMPDDGLSATLQGLLDSQAFVNSVSRLHELNAIRNALTLQQDNMALWERTLKRRQRLLTSMKGKQHLQSMRQRQTALTQRLVALGETLAGEDKKLFAFASVADKSNIRRLENIVPRIQLLQRDATPTRDLEQYKERWRRVRGLQLWRIYEHKPQRRWDVNRAYWQLQTESGDLLEQLNNTREALDWADSSWRGFPRQVEDAQQRIQQLMVQTDAVFNAEYRNLEGLTGDYLTALEQRITDYQAQARLSIARLYDDALQQTLVSEAEDLPDQGNGNHSADDENSARDLSPDQQTTGQPVAEPATPEVAGE